VEAILLRREVVDVALQAAAIEEGYYCLIPVSKKVSSRHTASLLLGCSSKNVTSSGKIIRDTSARPISPLRTDSREAIRSDSQRAETYSG
jgi:hypothetical protein